MTRIILLLTIVLNSGYAFADWPLIHFLKCRITTKDTTVVGYFTAPFEGMPDSVITKLKNDKGYFDSRVLKRLTTIELNSFTYIHYYVNEKKNGREHAIYKTKDRLILDMKSIVKIDLLEVINFQFVPNTVISTILEGDDTWMTRPIKQIIQSSDKCSPYRFLIYDDTVDYNNLIKEILKETDQQETLLKTLRENKIVGLRLNLCS